MLTRHLIFMLKALSECYNRISFLIRILLASVQNSLFNFCYFHFPCFFITLLILLINGNGLRYFYPKIRKFILLPTYKHNLFGIFGHSLKSLLVKPFATSCFLFFKSFVLMLNVESTRLSNISILHLFRMFDLQKMKQIILFI